MKKLFYLSLVVLMVGAMMSFTDPPVKEKVTIQRLDVMFQKMVAEAKVSDSHEAGIYVVVDGVRKKLDDQKFAEFHRQASTLAMWECCGAYVPEETGSGMCVRTCCYPSLVPGSCWEERVDCCAQVPDPCGG